MMDQEALNSCFSTEILKTNKQKNWFLNQLRPLKIVRSLQQSIKFQSRFFFKSAGRHCGIHICPCTSPSAA